MEDYVELRGWVAFSYDQLGMHHLARLTLLIPQFLTALVVRVLPHSVPQVTEELHLLSEAHQGTNLALCALCAGQGKNRADSVESRIGVWEERQGN